MRKAPPCTALFSPGVPQGSHEVAALRLFEQLLRVMASPMIQPPIHLPFKAPTAALGAGRASVLKSLVVPSTTTELARSLAISPSAVSQHLARLRRAGLAEPHRRGRRVYYRLSLCGEQPLDLFGELDDEAPPDRRPAPFSPGSIGS